MKAKKFLAMLMVGATVFSLTACGSSGSSSTAGSDNSGKQDAEAPKADAVVVQIAYENNPGEPTDLAANEWKRLIEEKSNGSMTVELFPSSQLGSKTDLVDQMQMGEGIIHIGDASFWADYGAPEMSIASAPYIYDNWDQYFKLLETDWWQSQVDLLAENGLRIVTSDWEYGTRELMTTKPVRTLDDLSGKMPNLRQQMMRLMSGEIKGDQDMILLLSKKNAEERLAAFIYNLSRRFAQRGFSPREFRLTMTRGDIGNYLGLTVETISRLLGRFQKSGMLAVKGKYITIENGEALAIDKQEIETLVEVRSGETLALGGIFSQKNKTARDSVPLLGDIPVLGRLFRRDGKDNERRELVVFITPRILAVR